MSKEYSFSVMPSVSISRSRFARKSQHKTSFNLGEIIPIYVDEVLPGDTRSIDMASLVRMSTPIAPIMDNIYLDFYAFYVPNRLVWKHWKEFMGENNESAGIPSTQYSIPTVKSTSSGPGSCAVRSIANYMGLPLKQAFEVSALPGRGYCLIYNEWFRNQNVIAPLAVDTSDASKVLVSDGTTYSASFFNPLGSGGALQRASKLADYFTKALPYAQKGAPVTIPLGNTAPIVAFNPNSASATTLVNTSLSLVKSGGSSLTLADYNAAQNAKVNSQVYAGNLTGGVTAQPYLVADLTNATAATINDLRYAFQLQKLLEKDALYGSRYWEILAAHFGIKAPDASLQRPEYLGGHRLRINVDQVLSTAGYDDTAAGQEVGKPGANSVTGGKMSLFTKSFTEHGYLFILAVARHDQTYAQGINRMWSRKNRFDFYFPVFANLGAQEVKNKEIFVQGTSADELVFGYQEAWSEYRYKPSISTALLDPNASGSLDFWTLTNKFAALPTLGQSFIEQGRDNLQRALTTGITGPDFIADFYFEDIAVRPMPMYSIPGLIDHH